MEENNKKLIKFRDQTKTNQEIFNPSYDQLINALLDNVCIVTFKKVTDGRTRQMKCTLDQKYMSGKYREFRLFRTVVDIWKKNSGFEVTNTFGKLKQMKRRTLKQGLLPVWDIENQDWRSFYSSNVSIMIIDTMKGL